MSDSDDGSGSDDGSLSSASVGDENPFSGYSYNDNNVLVPQKKRSSTSKETLPTKGESGSESSGDDDGDSTLDEDDNGGGNVVSDDDDDDDDDNSNDDESLGIKKAAAKPKKLVEDLGDSVDSWHFDLGALEANLKMVEEANKARQMDIGEAAGGLDEVMSKLSGMDDELSQVEREMSKADRSTEKMESKKAELKKNTTEQIQKRQIVRQKSMDMIEARKAERAARLERAKQRIDGEKEAERLKKQNENKMDMSEDARKARAYSWYSRCGHPVKKELIRRVRAMGKGSDIAVADIELLPWNFNGTMVMASKMMVLK
jgi:hypothetical protein